MLFQRARLPLMSSISAFYFSSGNCLRQKSSYSNINMIVACCENYVIGKDGQLPWKIPDDWKYFQTLTREGTLILGRRCYEERGYAFPNRETIVVSRTLNSLPDAQVARSVEEAISMAQVKLKQTRERVNELKICNDMADSKLQAPSSGETVDFISKKLKKHQIWICGGSQVYRDGAKFCSKLYLTRIHSSEIIGDTYFPASIPTLFPHLISKSVGHDEKYNLTYYVYGKEKALKCKD